MGIRFTHGRLQIAFVIILFVSFDGWIHEKEHETLVGPHLTVKKYNNNKKQYVTGFMEVQYTNQFIQLQLYELVARKNTKATHSIRRAAVVYSWGGSNLVPTATAVSRTRYSFSHQLSCWCWHLSSHGIKRYRAYFA